MPPEGQLASYGATLHGSPAMQRIVRYKAALLRQLRDFLHIEGALGDPDAVFAAHSGGCAG